MNPSVDAEPSHWNNVEVIRESVEEPRASFQKYTNHSVAQSTMSLSGDWFFNFAESPSSRPADFHSLEFDYQSWKTIPVPSNWERHGYGDPIYVNIPYPFKKEQPKVPTVDNPVGSYIKEFSIPKDWKEQQVFIQLGAVSSAFYLWVNGNYVGYSEGSKTPSEFNITEHITDGKNKIAIQVYRWSTGSYLEDQDMWSLSGIQRDVTLMARPKTRISDYFVKPGLTENYADGKLNLGANIKLDSDLVDAHLEVEVSSGGELIFTTKERLSENKITLPEQVFRNIKQWSAEEPNLYQLRLTLLQGETRLETIEQDIGFRTSEIKHGRFFINGKLVKLKGVNLHEHHHESGHVINEATMLQDIKLMKEANMNAVRTSHYPFPERFYELTDKYGLYVVDEANIETHGYGYDPDKTLANVEHWRSHHLDRMQRVVERDKNRASIVIWSLGNEAGDGGNIGTIYHYTKNRDQTRPVQYETEGDFNVVGERHSDFHSSMYWRHWDLEEYAQTPNDRPFVLIEYAHAMGNSSGNLTEYWEVINKHENLAGGFIWDWVDQGLLEYRDDKPFWTYGGDYGDGTLPSSGNFNMNGLLFSNREPQPGYYEVQKIYQEVDFELVSLSPLKIKLTNNYDFTDLAGYVVETLVLENGTQVSSQTQTLGTLLANNDLTIELPKVTFDNNVNTHLNIKLINPNSDGLLPENRVVAYEQFELSPYEFDLDNVTHGDLNWQVVGENVTIITEQNRFQFNLKTGWLSQWSFNDKTLLKKEITPDLWRAPIDNDYGNNIVEWAKVWRPNNHVFELLQWQKNTDGCVIKTRHNVSAKLNNELLGRWNTCYQISDDQELVINADFAPVSGMPSLPRVGWHTQLDASFTNTQWFGRGPFENYRDRNNAAQVGLYQKTVAEHYVPYAYPQENGYKTDVRYLVLQNDTGIVIELNGLQPFGFNVRDHSSSDLEPVWQMSKYAEDGSEVEPYLRRVNQHLTDIPKRDFVDINFDYGQTGVGGDNSWGGRTLQKYTLNKPQYKFGFMLKAKAR